jgi:tRNA 2-selenouridine synthase
VLFRSVAELLADHYDPIYRRSMARNFARLGSAPTVTTANGGAAEMARCAGEILLTDPVEQGSATA